MRKILLPFAFTLFIAILAGCSDNDNDNDSPSFSDDFDGTYEMELVRTRLTNANGQPCGGGVGTIKVDEGEISGSIIENQGGETVGMTGTVESSGDVSGSGFIDGEKVVTYEGKISGNTGSGSFAATGDECEGDWDVVKN